MTAFPYTTASSTSYSSSRTPSPPPPSPKYCRKPLPPTYYSQGNTSYIPPVGIPSVKPCEDPIGRRPGGPVNCPADGETVQGLKEASKRELRRKEGRQELRDSSADIPPTPVTGSYMRRPLPSVPSSSSASESAAPAYSERSCRVEGRREERRQAGRDEGQSAEEYLAEKRRKREKGLTGLAFAVAERRR